MKEPKGQFLVSLKAELKKKGIKTESIQVEFGPHPSDKAKTLYRTCHNLVFHAEETLDWNEEARGLLKAVINHIEPVVKAFDKGVPGEHPVITAIKNHLERYPTPK